MNNLACLLESRTRYAEAERLFRECLRLSERSSGPSTRYPDDIE